MIELTNAAAARTPLRELDEATFQARYDCDRFTATVLASRYRYVVKHMCTGLLTNAFSASLRDWYDFAATISGPPEHDYPMPAVSDSLALFLGTMADGTRNIVEEYGAERLRPGDVLVCNDPYRVGNHVNDILFVRPVFAGERIVGFVNLKAHMLDMGGTVPAGFSATKRNVYENGVVIPPMLMYQDDEPVRSTFSLLFDNARMGELMLPDVKSIFQNVLLGERLLRETVERYGAEACVGAMRYACDQSADAMADALERIPDGVYEGSDTIDADGVDAEEQFRVAVRIVKRGRRAELDFSGSSRQARTCINCGWMDTKTAVGVALKFLVDSEGAFTSGAFRPLDVVLPPGTFVSAMPPDGAIMVYWESSQPVVHAIFRALAGVLGEDAIGGDLGSGCMHNANGVRDDGTPWVSALHAGGEHGPWGATKHGDADSYQVIMLCNNLDTAVEACEAESPMILLRKEYAPDTGGAGVNRGGAAVLKDSLWLTPAQHYSTPLHLRHRSGFGVHGGADGAGGGVWLFEPGVFDVADARRLPDDGSQRYREAIAIGGVLDPATQLPDPAGEYVFYADVPIRDTARGAVYRYRTNGGGGWGDPFTRAPERVMRDVRDGYVSVGGAARDYGVVVLGDPAHDPEGLTIDAAATDALREATREAR
ncbi:hydantoinase B/oxoprolinase family protein [Conexibacter sp. CPCC 206217]|uniref:hydantoinase B/oxoprolinase family protein n=1 Tax=Conexibacter sp. CPCC 206217 TaxID=3064574 RepID=UPI00271CCB4D|nr:hydantoinase B/oxoprolinase family protein [Conexibacter sp. CPCC 206217]MDO8212228.1 hydantoinase B/oxoprolinase family protein [Conexibacter sp. CPCC 206217]